MPVCAPLKFLFLPLLLVIVFHANAQHKPWREHEMEVKIKFNDQHQAKALGQFNLKGDIYNTHAYLYLTPSELELVKESGFDCIINIPDLNLWSESFGSALVPAGYYTFNEIKNIADSLATHFPDICKKVVFGMTPQFKELAALKISDNVNVDENESEVMFDGGIHGNEVGGSQNVITFARDLCLAYGQDPYITGLIDHREIWLYYCVNPYGRDNMTRENGNGVDINRDFGYVCGNDGGTLGPFSQPESKALRDCQYSNQFVSYTNYHSGAETISYPWSYRYSPTPDNTHIYSMAGVYSSSSGYSSLPYGQGSQIMYLIEGSTKDYNYGCLGSVAWSMEISLDKQPAGPNIKYYYDINKPAMLAVIEHSGYGIEGTVTDAITGLPVKASVWVGNNYPTFTDGEAGDFHKYLVPGTYTIRITANGYQQLILTNITVSDLQSTLVDAQLQPIQSQFGYRTCISKIPNFNAQNPGDEGYSAACLGVPDQVNYSLGKGGYIMVDMQFPVLNEPGPDITVYEGDASPEGYAVYALTSMDGYWNYIGSGIGTSNFDLATGEINEATYFLLLDDNNGTANVNDAGFDFDAIANIHAPKPDTLAHLSGKVFDKISGFPLAGALITFADNSVITDTAGFYSIDQIRGENIMCASFGYYLTDCDTLQLAAGVQTEYNFYLDYNVGVQKTESNKNVFVSPNPFTEKLDLKFSTNKAENIKIYLTTITGSSNILLAEGSYPAGNHSLTIYPEQMCGFHLPQGVYILTFETAEKKEQHLLIKKALE
jgi:hypothetical protein